MSTHAFRRASPPRSAWKSSFAARRSPSWSAGRHGERTLGPSGRVYRSPSSATTRPVSPGRSTGATGTPAGTSTIGPPLCPTSTNCLPRSTQIRRPSSGAGGRRTPSMLNPPPTPEVVDRDLTDAADVWLMAETRPMPQRSTVPPTTLERGRKSFDQQAWADACDLLWAADREAPSLRRTSSASRWPRTWWASTRRAWNSRAGRTATRFVRRTSDGRRAAPSGWQSNTSGGVRWRPRPAGSPRRNASLGRDAASGWSPGICWSPPRCRASRPATRTLPWARTNEPPRSVAGSPTRT